MTTEQKVLVEKYHDYVLELIANFDLDKADFYDELCVELCELAIGKIAENVDEYFIDNLTNKFNAMLKRKLEEYELLVPLEESSIVGSMNTDRIHRRVALEEPMSKLTDKERICIDMYFYKGYTQAEISQELEISVSAVRTHLRKAQNKLALTNRMSLRDC